MLALYRLASRWPLPLLHALGALLGWLTWLASPTYRRRLAAHAALAGYGFAQVRPAVAHAGRMALETPRLWFGPPVPVRWDGTEVVDAA
ncbi:MAG: lysophospholipid acyltransferase family protein, partial [Burkholderiales bacterium]|nr:lysophospholipid acyltransferase family protein [Burkholderiales bacterium]